MRTHDEPCCFVAAPRASSTRSRDASCMTMDDAASFIALAAAAASVGESSEVSKSATYLH